MKRLSILLLSLLLTSFSSAVAHDVKFKSNNRGAAQIDFGNLEVTGYSTTRLEPNSAIDDSQCFAELEFLEKPLLLSLPRNFYESGSCFGSFMGLYGATPIKWDDPVKFDHDNGLLPESHLFNVFSVGGGPLFITGPIKKERNSVPESSTMLLLGLGLVGLAGYGGRKKFKR